MPAARPASFPDRRPASRGRDPGGPRPELHAGAGRALYATTGTSSDYVYSRHIANPALRKTYGFAFETGPFDGTTPTRSIPPTRPPSSATPSPECSP